MKRLVVALVVVVGVLGGFYGGYKFGQSNVSASSSTPPARSSPSTRGGGNFGAACPSPGSSAAAAGAQAVARGRITNLTSNSMTVTTGNCTVTIDFSNGTAVVKQDAGTTADLSANQTVTVVGVRQTDGSVRATTISIGGAAGPGGAPSAFPGAGG